MHDVLSKAKEEVEKLNKIISEHYKNSNTTINHEVLRKWIQYKNILNMYLVCRSFQRGSVYYHSDSDHPVRSAYPHDWRGYEIGTSLSTLKPIAYHKDNNETFIAPASYMLADDCQDAAKTLTDLLFSHTLFECRGGVQIAYYLTLLDLLKLVFGSKDGAEHFNKIFGSKPSKEAHQKLNRLRLGIMSDFETTRWHDFSVLYGVCERSKNISISLENLQLNPDYHIGARFWIGGIKDYTDKHTQGSFQGENAIFLGLNDSKEPLFFIIPTIGKEFFITYNELLTKLHSDYNAYPETIDNSNRKLVLRKAEKSELIGLNYGSVTFREKSLADLIDVIRNNTFEVFENFIEDYCKRFYELIILKEGYTIKNKKFTDKTRFFTDKIVTYSQDENDFIYQKAFKKNDLNQEEMTCKDDLNIKYT